VILFVDTSTLVKLYIEEAGSASMAKHARASRLAASVLAYAEIYATFGRRLREDLLTPEEHDDLVQRFERDWQSVIVMALRPALAARIPRLVGAHPLRGAAAVHLASALALHDAGLETRFAASDARLAGAATAEGFEVIDPAATARTGGER